jgi:ferritin
MLISDKLATAMSDQVGRELGASNQYAAIAAYFDGEGLPELATFFYRQSDEERLHAMKFVHYIAHGFLEWFVNEQLEEVSTMQELLSVIRRAGKDGLLFVEQYLARRGEPHAGAPTGT